MRSLIVIGTLSGCWSSASPSATQPVAKAEDKPQSGRAILNDAAVAVADLNTGFDLYVTPASVTSWTLDGELRTEKLPSRIRGIAAGAHEVKIDAPPGFVSQAGRVNVEAGKVSKVEIELFRVGGGGTFPGLTSDASDVTPAPAASARRTVSPPRPILGQLTVTKGIERAVVRRYLESTLMKLEYCYEKQVVISNDMDMHGTVTAVFSIGATGAVSTASATGLSIVDACVAEVIKSIEFPKPQNSETVNVSVPFTFVMSH